MRYKFIKKSHFVYLLGFAFSYDPTSQESRWCSIFFVIKGSQ